VYTNESITIQSQGLYYYWFYHFYYYLFLFNIHWYIFSFQSNSVPCGYDTLFTYYITWGLSTLAENPLSSFWRRCRGTVKNWKI